jgi:iron complex outermembrane receptor protein
VRYFSDEQTFRDEAAAVPVTQQGDFHATSPRAYVQYKFDGDANIYASAGKGFRSGGFNPQSNARPSSRSPFGLMSWARRCRCRALV